MTQRKHEDGSARIVNAPSQSGTTPSVNLTPPTDDEEKHLRSIEQTSSQYDPRIVVGGPRTVR
jgi:hypothetical protein